MDSLIRVLGLIGVLSLLIYMGLCGFLYFGQEKLIFPAYMVESAVNGPRLTLVQVDGTTDILINDKHAQCDVLYFGGNAESVHYSLQVLAKAFARCNVLATVYRGYGTSTGLPSQEALFFDALQLYKQRRSAYPAQQFIIVGRSLGAAVATYLASQVRADQLVLVTPFDSLENLAKLKFPWVPTLWLLKHPFRSDIYAQSVQIPVHVIIANQDEIIPVHSSLQLFGAFESNKRHLTRLDGAGHNTVDDHPNYFAALTQLYVNLR